MKKQDSKEHVSQRVFKHFFLYLYKDTVIGDFFMKKRNERKSITTQQALDTFTTHYTQELSKLLKARKVPFHWLQTFYDAVVKGELNLPMHEGITLAVGDYLISNERFDEKRVKKSGATHVSIVISSKASATQISEFIKHNTPLIEKLETLLDLPKLEYNRIDEKGILEQMESDYGGFSYRDIKNRSGLTLKRDTVKKTVTRYRNYLKPKT